MLGRRSSRVTDRKSELPADEQVLRLTIELSIVRLVVYTGLCDLTFLRLVERTSPGGANVVHECRRLHLATTC